MARLPSHRSAEPLDQRSQPLEPGQPAPLFSLRCVQPGGQWESAELAQSLQAGRYAVLVFFPMAFSPVCSAQLPGFSEVAQLFAALGADIYGLSRENPYVLRSWSRLLRLKVPLLSDMTLEVASQYGVTLPQYGVCRRAVFVVDPSGTVVYSFAEEDSTELTLEADDVLAWLEQHRLRYN